MCHTQIFSRKGGGCGAVLMAWFSYFSIYRFATMGLIGDPMAAPSCCSKNLSWKIKYVLIRQYSSSLVMFFTDKDVLLWSSGSSSSNYLMVFMAGLMGTEVKSALTSKETMH